jgi:predicted adenine nucleotide alpha hydrolase (AANH) superfamily ATPase
MRLALHTCCAPCLLEPFDALSPEMDEIVVVYANPNIHPFEEYVRRRDTLVAYARTTGIEVVELPYDPARWLTEVGVHGNDRARRCRACYALRLRMVSDWAAENGFGAVATTLTVSPYQDPDVIAEEGERAAESAGVHHVATDFRARYPQATTRSRTLEMYRQNYCGCLLSDLEARGQREARRARRAAESQEREQAEQAT